MNTSSRYGLISLVILTTLSCSIFSAESTPSAETPPAPADFPSLPQSTPPDSFKGVPIMPGALSGNAAGSAFQYLIEATALEVQEYYLREMPLAGWDLEDQSGDANQGETSIRLRYRKGENEVTIFITSAGEDVVQVTIM